MAPSSPVTIPLINPNEPEALLVEVHIREGQKVRMDELLCTLETTKSTAEVKADVEGFVIGLRFQGGEMVRAGEVLCYLAESPEWEPPQVEPGEQIHQVNIPDNMRISEPALELAHRHQVDLNQLPLDTLITSQMVQALIDQAPAIADFPSQGIFDPTMIIVYGGGGHGKALIELLQARGTYRIAGIVDDGLNPDASVLGLPVLGGNQVLAELYGRGIHLAVNAVGGIGDLQARLKVFKRLANNGFACPAVVHPRALVEPSASLSAGVQVFAHAYVGSESQVGYGTIINTGAIVSHDCQLGDYVNISPGAILAGEVQIGSGALIGMGVTVNLRVNIGAGARIGNGATVKSDVPVNRVVRAGTTWPE
ncbi:MAG TPA: NeuD/PglB/VioB family sugar acetyltransferase [Anaerolineales bacterium]|nr:NeuD/PglB/VioB family sugar acetyltransferase [Anaerolineales bacterium]